MDSPRRGMDLFGSDVVENDDDDLYGDVSEEDAADRVYEQRMIARAAKENQLAWEQSVRDIADRSRWVRLVHVLRRHVVGYPCWLAAILLVWACACAVLAILWIVFGVLMHTSGISKETVGFIRLACLMIVAFGGVLICYYLLLRLIERLLQAKILLGPHRMNVSLALFTWGLVFLLAFRSLTYREVPWNCDDDDDTVTQFMVTGNSTAVVEEESGDDDVCFSWYWVFLTCTVVGALWIIRNVAEELILYLAGVRLDTDALSIATVREVALAMLGRHMRDRQIIPHRSDKNNEVPDLYIGVRSLRQDDLLSELRRTRFYTGDFRERRNRRDEPEIVKAVTRQAIIMFLALDKVGDGHLEASSFDPIEGPLTPVEVVLLFDRSGHGTVTKEEFIATIIETYFNREKVWDSYMDRQQVSQMLRYAIGILFWVCMLCLALILARVSVTTVLLPAASFFLGLSFAFGGLVQTVVESFVLLLFSKPFDVSDKVIINDESLNVYRMGLFRTQFYTSDGRLVSLPNHLLLATPIWNVTRSRNYVMKGELVFGHEVPGGSILEFQRLVQEYLESQPDTFISKAHWIHVNRIEETNRVVLSFGIPLKGIPWSSWGEYAPVVTQVNLVFHKIARRLGITYSLPLQPYTTIDPSAVYSTSTPRVSRRKRSRGGSSGDTMRQ